MTASPPPTPARYGGLFQPLWWRLVAWSGMTAVSVLDAHHGRFGLPTVGVRVLAGVLFAVAGLAVQVTDGERNLPRRRAAVIIATVAGLASIVAAPGAVGEVPVYFAASRIPFVFTATRVRTIVIADALATSAVVALASHSVVGALAGAGVPLFAQRAAERRELIEQRDRARALLLEIEAARDAEAEAAAVRERSRIAREMHDVLAHSLAGLSLHLQAVRAVAVKQAAGPAILEPLDRAADLARAGLTEARSAMGALRDPGALGLDQLPDLVARYPGRASLTVVGPVRALPGPGGHAVYRGVQEALTNAARYAPGSAVTVAVTWSEDAVTVSVGDDGTGAGTPTPQGTGLGLVGMSERVRAAGGTMSAGPDGPGWRVTIRMPA